MKFELFCEMIENYEKKEVLDQIYAVNVEHLPNEKICRARVMQLAKLFSIKDDVPF